MPKSTRQRFTVSGSGAFPFDMLRYDACWPESEGTDSYQLTITADTDPKQYFARREVTLLTESRHGPTPGRWASFNWRVVKVEPLP